MRWFVLLLMMSIQPAALQAGTLEEMLVVHVRIIQMQKETDSAVRWVLVHGYNDRVAFQFLLRCGLLRRDPEGEDWCAVYSSHRELIGMADRYGSQQTRWLVKSYRDLEWQR